MEYLLIPKANIEKRLESTNTMAGQWANGIRDSLTQILAQEETVELIEDRDVERHLANWLGVNNYKIIRKCQK